MNYSSLNDSVIIPSNFYLVKSCFWLVVSFNFNSHPILEGESSNVERPISRAGGVKEIGWQETARIACVHRLQILFSILAFQCAALPTAGGITIKRTSNKFQFSPLYWRRPCDDGVPAIVALISILASAQNATMVDIAVLFVAQFQFTHPCRMRPQAKGGLSRWADFNSRICVECDGGHWHHSRWHFNSRIHAECGIRASVLVDICTVSIHASSQNAAGCPYHPRWRKDISILACA